MSTTKVVRVNFLIFIFRGRVVICWIQNNRCTSPQLVLLFKRFQEIVLIWTMRRLPLADNTLYYSLCPFLFLFVAFCAMIIKIWCYTFVALFSELIHAETGSFCLWKRPCNGCRFSPLQLKERARGLSLNHVTIWSQCNHLSISCPKDKLVASVN